MPKKKSKWPRHTTFGVGELKKYLPELLHRVEELHEFNPMLGHRGCRLGITYPEITEMQARAIFEAAVQVAEKRSKGHSGSDDPAHRRRERTRKSKSHRGESSRRSSRGSKLENLKYYVGTMIEIPRAAITADHVAKEAEFFSFGTNDLTQQLGTLARRLHQVLQTVRRPENLQGRPFAVLDQDGVGKLVELAVKLGRKTRPDLEVGICASTVRAQFSRVLHTASAWTTYLFALPLPIARLAPHRRPSRITAKPKAQRTA